MRGLVTTEVEVTPQGIKPKPGTEKEWPADLVILAMGFVSPEEYIISQMKLDVDQRNNIHAMSDLVLHPLVLSPQPRPTTDNRLACTRIHPPAWTSAGTGTTARPSRACSPLATAAAASRLSCGRSTRAAAQPTPSTPTSTSATRYGAESAAGMPCECHGLRT